MKIKNKINFYLLVFFLTLFAFLLSDQINLTTSDLGRHIKNGEMILSGNSFLVIHNNYYSYTFLDYPFINHHWGTGVIFFIVHKFFGFSGLTVFFVLLSLITFWLFFDTSRRKSNFSITFLSSVLLLPLLIFRREIRPEVFSYFFCGLFLWLLSGVEEKRISLKWLMLLPLLQMIWINLHIYFFFGFVLMGFFLIKNLKQTKLVLRLTLVIIISLFLSGLNPFGYKGLFFPLNIFENYGYEVLENQSVWFIKKVVGYFPANYFFIISFLAVIISWSWALKLKKSDWVNWLFFIFISFLGWTAIRNFTIYAFFAIWFISGNLEGIKILKNETNEKKVFLLVSTTVFLLFGLYLFSPSYWQLRNPGFGLNKNNKLSAEFFLKNSLKGPIFNNYDIGGYLIFNLYPSEKVFVDNRPEAYPAGFFKEVYIPIQENRKEWLKAENKYLFNTIFFSWRDITPWSQQFLENIIKDPTWAPVYVDSWSLILVKRNQANQEIIEKFQIPSGMFSFVKN